ncbi:MAG: hypothetical protein AAF050_22275, partial [Cyanobacteria bacterium J06649_5]
VVLIKMTLIRELLLEVSKLRNQAQFRHGQYFFDDLRGAIARCYGLLKCDRSNLAPIINEPD